MNKTYTGGDNVMSILGLFVPMPIWEGHREPLFMLFGEGWVFTLTIGKIPLGWIIIILAIIF